MKGKRLIIAGLLVTAIIAGLVVSSDALVSSFGYTIGIIGGLVSIVSVFMLMSVLFSRPVQNEAMYHEWSRIRRRGKHQFIRKRVLQWVPFSAIGTVIAIIVDSDSAFMPRILGMSAVFLVLVVGSIFILGALWDHHERRYQDWLKGSSRM
jgi:uncharacterized protein (DUF983 family)